MCLRILIVARVLGACLRFRALVWRVCVFFVEAIGVVCAPRLLFTCWGVGACLSCECVIWGVWLIVAGFHVGVRGKAAGRVVRCGAKPGGCRLTGADGELTPHFASVAEGEAFLAEQEAAQRGGFTAGAGDGEAKTATLTECGDGSGLAVDAAGRWYRDDELVENMVEAVRDDGETVVLTGDDGVSVVSDGNTNIYVRGGSFGDLINVGYHSDYDTEDEIMSVVNDARVDRAFGLVVSQVGGDASIRVMGDYVEPGNPTHVTPSYVEDLWNRASVGVASGETKIVSMMGEARVGMLTGKARVGQMSGESRINTVESGGGVNYMLGRAHVGEVRSHRREDGYMEHGRIGTMTGEASVEIVRDSGFVGEVRERASVHGVFSGGRVMEVKDDARVNMVVSGGVVEHVTDNARVGEVWRGGGVDKVDGKGAAVMNVGSGGRVGLVTGGATVVDVGSSDASEACVVGSVDSSSKVSLIDCWADVTYECGESNMSPARAREFVAKRLHDDATGIGGECLARANGDNPYSRSNVRLRVRDAQGRVVDVPDVDGVLRELVEVDDDEREMMWEHMMGSPDSNR